MTAPAPPTTRRTNPLIVAVIVLAVLVAVAAGAIAALVLTRDGGPMPEPVAAAAVPSSPTPAPSPSTAPVTAAAMTPVEACTEAARLLTGDALNIITEFVDEPDLSTITDDQLGKVIGRMNRIQPHMPDGLGNDIATLTGPLIDLRNAKSTGENITIETGVYADLGPKVIVDCGPYVPDGALADEN